MVGFLFLLPGIFNSRIGSILGWELWIAGGLACKLVVVGPGAVVGFRLVTAAGY